LGHAADRLWRADLGTAMITGLYSFGFLLLGMALGHCWGWYEARQPFRRKRNADGTFAKGGRS
jgi:hypothetical protein